VKLLVQVLREITSLKIDPNLNWDGRVKEEIHLLKVDGNDRISFVDISRAGMIVIAVTCNSYY